MIKEKEKKLGPIIKSGIFLGSSKGAKSTQYIQRGPKYGGFCAGGSRVDPGESEVPGTEQRSHSKYILAVNCPH